MELSKYRSIWKGFGYFIGNNWSSENKWEIYVDCFLGGGWHQGYYKGQYESVMKP
jgi:hypothetical protein